MSLASATKLRLTNGKTQRQKEYSEVWERRDDHWHMLYDSEGNRTYERITAEDFGDYARCFDRSEELP